MSKQKAKHLYLDVDYKCPDGRAGCEVFHYRIFFREAGSDLLTGQEVSEATALAGIINGTYKYTTPEPVPSFLLKYMKDKKLIK